LVFQLLDPIIRWHLTRKSPYLKQGRSNVEGLTTPRIRRGVAALRQLVFQR
jgi:hypothetical protein